MNRTAEETVALLAFFSQTQAEQWKQVPDEIKPIWVDFGEFATDKPILLLAAVLVDHLNGVTAHLESPVPAILDEIRALLQYWMIDSPFRYVFSKRPDTDERDRIWVTIQRLCAIALEELGEAARPSAEYNFGYFQAKYSSPLDCELPGVKIL